MHKGKKLSVKVQTDCRETNMRRRSDWIKYNQLLARANALACITVRCKSWRQHQHNTANSTGRHSAKNNADKIAMQSTHLSTHLAANAVYLHLVPGFLSPSLRHRSQPRPPLHAACLPLSVDVRAACSASLSGCPGSSGCGPLLGRDASSTQGGVLVSPTGS